MPKNITARSPRQATAPQSLRPVYGAVFVDMVAFALLLPVLPFYAMRLGAPGFGLGMLLTSYSAAKLLGATTAGRLSDRYGRRPVLVACLAGSAMSFVVTAASGSLLMLVVARAIAGLFGGTVATAQAYIADVTPPQRRARNMGLIGASIGVGFVVGPALGAGLGQFGFTVTAGCAAALAAANALHAYRRLEEPTSLPGGGVGDSSQQSRSTEPREALGLWRGPALVLIASFFTIFAFVSMETTLAFLANARFELKERGFGLVLAYVGTLMIIVQGLFIGRLAPRLGERTLALAGAALLGGGMLLIPPASTMALLLLALAVVAVGQGLASPSLASLLSRQSGHNQQGGMLGLGQSVGSAARALAPLMAGWLYDVHPAHPYLAAGTLALVAGLALVPLVSPRPARQQASRA